MKVTVTGFGTLRQFIPSKNAIIEIEDSATVRSLIEKLKDCFGNSFYDYIIEDNELTPSIVALLNGLSINMKKGLNTELKDGDRLVFTFMINGG